MRATLNWLGGLAVTALAVTVCYFWLDRPIALWVHAHLRLGFRGAFAPLVHLGDPLIPLAGIALIAVGLRAVMIRSMPKAYQAATLVASVSVLVTEGLKDELKFVFGRAWPASWMGNNPSFIRDGVYGFHFLHGGDSYQSFPSGHMAASCAVLAVLWVWYPRWRVFYCLAALAVGLGLVATNYHFLGDVIAGAFLGASVSWIATAIWRALVAGHTHRAK